MENGVLDQLTKFACALVWGGCVGLLYEVFGLLRALGRGMTALADLLFWTLTAVTTFLFLVARNSGAADGYLLVSIGGGAVLVHLMLEKPVGRLGGSVRESILRRRRRRKVRVGRKKRQKNQKNFV